MLIEFSGGSEMDRRRSYYLKKIGKLPYFKEKSKSTEKTL